MRTHATAQSPNGSNEKYEKFQVFTPHQFSFLSSSCWQSCVHVRKIYRCCLLIGVQQIPLKSSYNLYVPCSNVLIVSSAGFPLYSHVYPTNTADFSLGLSLIDTSLYNLRLTSMKVYCIVLVTEDRFFAVCCNTVWPGYYTQNILEPETAVPEYKSIYNTWDERLLSIQLAAWQSLARRPQCGPLLKSDWVHWAFDI